MGTFASAACVAEETFETEQQVMDYGPGLTPPRELDLSLTLMASSPVSLPLCLTATSEWPPLRASVDSGLLVSQSSHQGGGS